MSFTPPGNVNHRAWNWLIDQGGPAPDPLIAFVTFIHNALAVAPELTATNVTNLLNPGFNPSNSVGGGVVQVVNWNLSGGGLSHTVTPPVNTGIIFTTTSCTLECFLTVPTGPAPDGNPQFGCNGPLGGNGRINGRPSQIFFTCNNVTSANIAATPGVHHCALVGGGPNTDCYIDGVNVATIAQAGPSIVYDGVTGGNIGRVNNLNGGNPGNVAFLGPLRVTMARRYTANFTPPTFGPFPLV